MSRRTDESCLLGTKVGGLRERKKARTASELVDAAYALLGDGGPAALTAEAIADRVGVSRRTFFNYFSSVDAVLVRGLSDLLDEVSIALAASPTDEPLLDALARLTDSPSEEALLHRIATLGAAGATNPQTKVVLHTAMLDWLDDLIAFVRSRVPAGTDELYVVNLATAIVSAAQAAIIVWSQETSADLSPEGSAAFRANLTRSISYIQRGFDPRPVG